MERLELDPILEDIAKTMERHKLGEGKYARWLWQNPKNTRRLSVDPYACCDAVNIQYVLRQIPKDEETRRASVTAIQELQDPESGLFMTATHHVIHTTAHCVSTLELLDAEPLYPFSELNEYRNIENVFEMLEERDWLHRGLGAHPGAGIFTALVQAGLVGDDWIQAYFDWFDLHCDPGSGFWKKEPVNDFYSTIWQQMRDATNFYFNYEYAHRAFPYPEALINSCLDAYLNDQMPDDFGLKVRHFELDWVYCLNRASRQTAHRFGEIKRALGEFAEFYLDFLQHLDWEQDEGANDLHFLFGALCCLAELQQALPGRLHSAVPLRQILDQRPF